MNKILHRLKLCERKLTGKTETCKILAKTFFGSENALIKINMGEFSDRSEVSKLTGSAPGLVGSEEEPKLIKSIREHPNALVLFD